MSNNYEKKYDIGNLSLDLPYANCIYELPLLSFCDMRSTVNLSLVFNQALKAEGENPFNITSGYKLNLQKRIIFGDTTPKFQEENGKLTTLWNDEGSTVYSFDDDSQRIIRLNTDCYELEKSDYSKEIYDLTGKIIAVKDKYNEEILSYIYQNNILTSIRYRANNESLNLKEIVFE